MKINLLKKNLFFSMVTMGVLFVGCGGIDENIEGLDDGQGIATDTLFSDERPSDRPDLFPLPNPINTSNIDVEARPFVFDYFDQAQLRGFNLSQDGLTINFNDLAGGVAATFDYDTDTILIDDLLIGDDVRLRETIFHALHAVITDTAQRDDSIMQQVGFVGVNSATIDDLFDTDFFNTRTTSGGVKSFDTSIIITINDPIDDTFDDE